MGLLPEAGKGAAPAASCFELLRVLGFFPPPRFRFCGSLLYYFAVGIWEIRFTCEYIWKMFPEGTLCRLRSPLP